MIVGGSKNIKAQEAELRARPDIVVCTPGRMVDHISNSASIHLEDVEILVLDEVSFTMCDIFFLGRMSHEVRSLL